MIGKSRHHRGIEVGGRENRVRFNLLQYAGAAQFPVHKWREYADVLSTPRHRFLRLVTATYFPEMLPYVVFRDGQQAAHKGL